MDQRWASWLSKQSELYDVQRQLHYRYPERWQMLTVPR